MGPQTVEALRCLVSDLVFFGFCFSCAMTGAIVVAEIGVWMGVVKRRGDDDEEDG